MNLVAFALRRPVTTVVLIIAVVLAGILAGARMPRDVFPDQIIPMLFGKINGGPGGFNQWTINGKPFEEQGAPQELRKGARYRLAFTNRTDDAHPVHLHRSVFELTNVYGKQTAGSEEGRGTDQTIWAHRGGFHRRTGGIDLVPLPSATAYGLWIYEVVQCCLNGHHHHCNDFRTPNPICSQHDASSILIK